MRPLTLGGKPGLVKESEFETSKLGARTEGEGMLRGN